MIIQANTNWVFFPVDFPTTCEIKNGTVLTAMLPAFLSVEVSSVYVCDTSYSFHILVSNCFILTKFSKIPKWNILLLFVSIKCLNTKFSVCSYVNNDSFRSFGFHPQVTRQELQWTCKRSWGEPSYFFYHTTKLFCVPLNLQNQIKKWQTNDSYCQRKAQRAWIMCMHIYIYILKWENREHQESGR